MAKPKLIVALDLPALPDVADLLDKLPDAITWYKVGLELFAASGPEAVRLLTQRGKHVFLDLKLHDIPRTVARAVTAAAGHGVNMLTIHASGGHAMLIAAADAAAALGDRAPTLLAITALTSLDQQDLSDQGISRSLDEHVLSLGAMAASAGIHGLVCSVWEAARFRTDLGPDTLLITPGVRAADAEAGDQKRVATPTAAVRAGSDFLVVGRPILQAADPAAAATAIMEEMTQALENTVA